MKITKINSQKKSERVNVFIDGEFAFGLDKELVFKYDLKKNMEIDEDFLKSLIYEEDRRKTIHFALNYLSYRPRSIKELKDHLVSKEYNSENIDYTIDYLLDKGYLNDWEFAQSFIRDRVKLKKHGSHRIKYELSLKGVDREIIDSLLEDEELDEYSQALSLAEKKISSYKKDDRNSQYRKLSGFLQRRGYPFPVISKVLDRVIK